MQIYHLTGMAAKLVKDGLVSDEKEALAIQSLSHYWENAVAIVWTTDDVIKIAEKLKMSVTFEEAQKILNSLFKHHVPEKGLTIFTIIKELKRLNKEVF